MLKKHTKILKIVIVCFCLFSLSGCSRNSYQNLVLPSGQTIKVKLARSSSEFIRGLSGIKKLEDYDGMFFIKDQPGKTNFWMKDMQFPLDIIYLNKELIVVDVFLNNPPCSENICPGLSSQSDDVQHILEIPAGFAEKYDLSLGKEIQKK